MKKIFLASLLLMLSIPSTAAIFKGKINEIQVYEDRVRIHIGEGYGNCGAKEGLFGWYINNLRHSDWLTLVLTAKTSNTVITCFDEQSSCEGMSNAVEIEGVFLPLNNS